MIDIIVRCCGVGENSEWLPLIKVAGDRSPRFEHGTELYRGERQASHEAAWNKAVGVWESSATGNIVEFKREMEFKPR